MCRHVGAASAYRRWVGRKPLRHQLLHSRSAERGLAGQQLVEQVGQAVLIAARVRPLAADLFRAQVRECSRNRPGHCLMPCGRFQIQRPCESEVGHDGVTAGQQNVLRLDVAMYDAARVRVRESIRDLGGQPHAFGGRDAAVAVQTIAQRLALDERHNEEKRAVRLTRVVHRQDVRVLQIGGDGDLVAEPLDRDAGRKLRTQHLERDGPFVVQVARKEHGG